MIWSGLPQNTKNWKITLQLATKLIKSPLGYSYGQMRQRLICTTVMEKGKYESFTEDFYFPNHTTSCLKYD